MSQATRIGILIYGGFGLLVAMIAVVGGIAFWSFTTASGQYDEYSRVSENTVRVLLVDRNLVGLRRNAQRYLGSAEAANLKRVDELGNELRNDLTIIYEATVSQERRQLIARVREQAEAYSRQFKSAADLMREKDALIANALEPAGLKARTEITELFQSGLKDDPAVTAAAGAAQETVMRVRLNALRFFNNPTDESRRKVVELLREAKTAAAALVQAAPDEARRARAGEVVRVVDGYETQFARVADLALEVDKLSDTVLEAIASEMNANITQLRKLQRDRLGKLDEAFGKEMSHSKTLIGGLALAAAILGIGCAMLIGGRVGGNVREMENAAVAAEQIGDLIGLAANGDFRHRVSLAGRRGFIVSVSVALNQLLDAMTAALTSIRRDASTVAEAATSAAGAVIEVNAGASEQLRALEQVQDAIGQAARDITRVSDGAQEARDKTRNSAGLAEGGRTAVDKMMTRMEGMAENSRRVGRMAETISQIATKTTVLSTAAAVEAARAGEHGKGFAVIAQQVGALAESTSFAASEVTEIIEAAGRETDAGLIAAQRVQEAIGAIARQMTDTDKLMQEIADIVLNQRSAITQIDASVGSLAAVGHQNVAASTEISQVLERLKQLAAATQEQVARFHTA